MSSRFADYTSAYAASEGARQGDHSVAHSKFRELVELVYSGREPTDSPADMSVIAAGESAAISVLQSQRDAALVAANAGHQNRLAVAGAHFNVRNSSIGNPNDPVALAWLSPPAAAPIEEAEPVAATASIPSASAAAKPVPPAEPAA
jgi:hypothetical protein